MEPFEPLLRNLAMQLGISFTADGVALPAPFDPGRDIHDIGVMAAAMQIENALHFKDITERQRVLSEAANSIDDWSQILGKHDRRVQILREMHVVANSIVEGSRETTAGYDH
jgi:hypothetical protein